MPQEFKSIWAEMTPEEKRDLAQKTGHKVEYLSQVAIGYRGPSKKMIRKLVDADIGLTLDMFL